MRRASIRDPDGWGRALAVGEEREPYLESALLPGDSAALRLDFLSSSPLPSTPFCLASSLPGQVLPLPWHSGPLSLLRPSWVNACETFRLLPGSW